MGLAAVLLILSVGAVFGAPSEERENSLERRQIPPIFPPNFKPGDVLEDVRIAKINDALDDLHRAPGVLNSRACAIGIANSEGLDLKDPRWYIDTGNIYSVAPREVTPGNTGLLLFTRQTVTFGTKGVVTYKIGDSGYMLAVFWTVPVTGSKRFNMKIVPESVGTGKDLYKQLEKWGDYRAQGYEYKNEYGVKLTGTMTDHNSAKLIVWVDTTGFDVTQGPDNYAACSYNTIRFRSYCWRESAALGWCWTAERCSGDNMCNGNMACRSDCNGEGEEPYGE